MTVYTWSVLFACVALAFMFFAHLMRSSYTNGPVLIKGQARMRHYMEHPLLALISATAGGMSFAFGAASGETTLIIMSLVVGVFCVAMHWESFHSLITGLLNALEQQAQTPAELIAECGALKKTVAERDVEIGNLKGQIEVLSKHSNIVSIERPAPRSAPVQSG
jgi:hypothetical protein